MKMIMKCSNKEGAAVEWIQKKNKKFIHNLLVGLRKLHQCLNIAEEVVEEDSEEEETFNEDDNKIDLER
jgi:hypothetical protein